MEFVRTYKSGGEDYDPRQIKWAEFNCTVCGEETNIDVTANGSFDYERVRECPHCKSFGKDDYKNNIKKKIKSLTMQQSKIQVEIDKAIRELGEIEDGENVASGVCDTNTSSLG